MKKISLDKRQKFAIETLVLTGGILLTQIMWTDYRFIMVFVLSLLSYGLTVWSLSEDIRRIEWIMLFILPVLYTASMSLFYFLLPERWISRIIITVGFSIGMYAILLVENILNVAADRSIQLIRAAHSVGFLLTLTTTLLFSTIIFSLRLAYWQNMIIMAGISFLLALQSLWAVNLETRITGRLILYSVLVAVGIGELSLILSFWPIENSAFSLLLAASFYTMVGIAQLWFQERLFLNNLKEYLWVIVFTLILTYVTTRWGG